MSTRKRQIQNTSAHHRVRIQQAWELEPTLSDLRIAPCPTDVVRKPVLPNQKWADQDLAGFASFTVSL